MRPFIALPGLRPDSPAAALALYGIAYLLGEGTAVRWAPDGASGWHAEVSSDDCADLDGLVERLVEAIRLDALTTVVDLAKDVNELTPEKWGEAVEGGGGIGRMVTGLCAEAPERQGGRVSLTPVCVYSFGTRGTLFGNASKQDDTVAVKDVRALLAGSSESRKGCNTLGLDPGARRQQGAIMGPDPSADGVRGIPGLVPLALRGLAAVAPMPGTRSVRGGAFMSSRDGVEFQWPIFTASVPAEALHLVVGRQWSGRPEAQRAAAGIEAVFASRILRAERRLSIGRRIA